MTDSSGGASQPKQDGDNPILSGAQDRLDRAPTAQALAAEYRALNAEEGFVTALMGPWGSGKTSLVNMIREELAAAPAIVVLDFNPWLFTGTDALVSSFFRELSAQLRDQDRRTFGTLADQLAGYGELLGPLVWLPGVGGWAARLKSVAEAVNRHRERNQPSVHDAKSQLTKALAKLEKPIVVVIDDIDRLSSAEIQDVFRLVRLTANFPNIVYLLAFDRARVEAALEADGLPGRSYLEKIVQSGYDLPAVPDGVLWTQVAEALQGVSDSLPPTDEVFDANRWPDLASELIMPQINSMRDVRRYAVSLRPTLASLRSQMDVGDLLALEAFRVFQPDLFMELRARIDALTTPMSWGGSTHGDVAHKESMTSLMELAGSRSGLLRDLIARIFPAAIRHLENNSYGTDWQKTWLKHRRAAHPHIARLYFERVAPSGLTAFTDGEKAFSLLTDTAAFAAFMTEIAPERLQDVIAALETFEGDFPTEHLSAAMAHLLALKDSLPERQRGFLDLMDAGLVVDRVVLRMLRQFSETSDVEEAVNEMWGDLTSLSDQYDVGQLVSRGKHENEAGLVSDEFVDQLRKQIADTVTRREWSRLAGERRVISLWLATEEWGDGLKTLSLDEPAHVHLNLIKACRGTIRSQAMGNRHVSEERTLNWDTLVKLYGSEDAIRAVRDVVAAAYGPAQPELLELLDRYIAGQRHRGFEAFDEDDE